MLNINIGTLTRNSNDDAARQTMLIMVVMRLLIWSQSDASSYLLLGKSYP